MKYTYYLLLVFSILACSTKNEKQDSTTDEIPAKEASSPDMSQYPELLRQALDAHGGLALWQKYGTLSFTTASTLGEVKTETQLIDLNSRKVLIEGDSFKLGMDGKEVWVTPNKEAFGSMSPRFYHNLIFYFFSIPYVFADPGINYEDIGERTIEGKTYRALKVSYNEGIGDADGDYYIAHFNPDTFQLELLLYTVTYYSGESHENYNALLYPEWQEVDGLLLPKTMIGHKFKNDTIGEIRYKSEFSNIKLDTNTPDQSIFVMPEGAEIDSLKSS